MLCFLGLLLTALCGAAVGGALARRGVHAGECAEVFHRIGIAARCGGMTEKDVLFSALGRGARLFLWMLPAAWGIPLILTGCAALFFDGCAFGYTALALIGCDGLRGTLLSVLLLLPPVLLLWNAAAAFGTFALCGRRIPALGCAAAGILAAFLQQPLTFQCMKLLPLAI